MAAHDAVSFSFFAKASSYRRSFKRTRIIWVCAARGRPGGEGTDSSANDYPLNSFRPRQDHYALLGIRSDASLLDIKLAFRQLARKYHPDVNSECGAADIFKTILQAYETLSDKTSRNAYDKILRAQAQPMIKKRSHKSHPNRSRYERGVFSKQSSVPHGKTVDCKVGYDWKRVSSVRRERFSDYFDGRKASFCEGLSGNWDNQKSLSLRQGWAKSLKDVILMFCLVGFIWHTLGAQLALMYFVFFIPHNTEHSPLYRLASLMALLIGGTKGLALHYGIATTGWLYGKSHDIVLVLSLSIFWIEAQFPKAFRVPHGATLLMAHICLGGGLPH